MRPGSTPTHRFEIPIDLTKAEKVVVIYKQDNRIVRKTGEDLQIDAESITVKLSQKDTLAFDSGNGVKIQVRYRFGDGTADVSDILVIEVDEVLTREEI